MSWTCTLFGHNYSVSSVFGNYAFCSKCGSSLAIKDPFQLQPKERRFIADKLYECNNDGVMVPVPEEEPTLGAAPNPAEIPPVSEYEDRL